MNVLVTGGAGFIGSHIVDALIKERHSVAVMDDLSTGSLDNLNPQARFYEVSITDAEKVGDVFGRERPEVVNHHAAQTDVRRSMTDSVLDTSTNVLGTVGLLEASVRWKVRRFIFASTCAVYTESRDMPMGESHPTGPQSTYGLSKLTAEQYVGFFANFHGLKHKILRYGNVYGPRQNPKGEAGVVAIFAGQLLGDGQPTIYGDGTKTRDYIFVEDVVRANLVAMREAGDDQIFNVARGREVTDFEVFEAVRRAVGTDVAPRYASRRPGEALRVCLDSSRAAEILEWRPTVSLEDGIRRSIEYYRRSQRLQTGK